MVSKAARAGTPGTERTRRQQLGLLRLVIVLGLVDGVTILLCPRAITSANAVPWGGLFAEMRNSCAEMKSLAACQISSLVGAVQRSREEMLLAQGIHHRRWTAWGSSSLSWAFDTSSEPTLRSLVAEAVMLTE